MCGVSWACSLAGRFSDARLAAEPTPGRRRGVSRCNRCQPNIGDGGDDLRGHSKAIAPLVPGDVVRDQPGTGSVRSACNAFLAWAVIRPPGLGCHKLRRAMVRGVISWAARSRWTKPMSAAGKPASWGDRRRRRFAIAAEVRGRGTGRIRMPRRGCGCEEPDLCPNNRGAWRDRPNRWLVSLQWSGEPRL